MSFYSVIKLTQGYVAVVDRANIRGLSRYKWHVHFSGGRGRKSGQPYARATIGGKKTYLHQFLVTTEPGQHVDHKNHQTLDCRLENLEVVDHVTNNRRRRCVKKDPGHDE